METKFLPQKARAMAPKMRAMVKARAKGKAKAKAKAKAHPMVLHRPARPGRLGLRRPARADPGDPPEDAEEAWKKGEVVKLGKLDPRTLSTCPHLVVTVGDYYHQPCAVAGKVIGASFEGKEAYLRMKLTGTQNESLLQHHTGNPGLEYRGHLCLEACNGEVVADDLIHLRQGRLAQAATQEEGWVRNLEGTPAGAETDELSALRGRAEAALGLPEAHPKDTKGEKKVETGSSKDKKKKKKKRKKEKKEKGEKKSKRSPSEKKEERKEDIEVSSSESEEKHDGRTPKMSSKKTAEAIFGGTGLDPDERIRNRVARRARRYLKKKSEKDSSSGESSGSSSSGKGDSQMTNAETLYGEASKVMVLAEAFPGALTSQALTHMRMGLVQELGLRETASSVQPVATAYFRQHLMRRASAPMSRELLTLSTILDQLLLNRPAAAADTATQRIKSLEQSLGGSHWAVAQKLEVLPSEGQTLTPLPEATAAQRQVYQESRMRWASGFPDGRGQKAGQDNRGKSDGRQGQGKGKGKDKTNKGQTGNKGDAPKKKE